MLSNLFNCSHFCSFRKYHFHSILSLEFYWRNHLFFIAQLVMVFYSIQLLFQLQLQILFNLKLYTCAPYYFYNIFKGHLTILYSMVWISAKYQSFLFVRTFSILQPFQSFFLEIKCILSFPFYQLKFDLIFEIILEWAHGQL